LVLNLNGYFEDLTVSHDGTKTNVPTMVGSSSGDVNGTFVPIGRNAEVLPISYFAEKFHFKLHY
jgi:hypothetical protein